MKKVKRLLGLVISLVMFASIIPANAAETSTKVFSDDFSSAEKMSEYELIMASSYTGPQVWLDSNVLKINQGRGVKKTFDTPYTGMVAVEYDAGMNSEVRNVIDVGLTATDGKACVFHLGLKDYLSVRGEDGTQFSSLSWHAPSIIKDNLSDTLNHIKLVFDFGKQEIYVTVSNENSTKTEMVGKFPVEMKAVTYIKMSGAGGSGWGTHTTFDNVEVWQRDIITIPEYTYLQNNFTNLNGDYFGGDLYPTVKYAVDSNQGLRNPTDASSTDPIATSLIKFENGAMEVGNGYTDPTTQVTSNYCAVIEMPEQINNEMVELSFKARMKDPTAQGKFGKVALFAKGVCFGISMYWDGEYPDKVRFNHQYGQANQNGFEFIMPEDLHEYKFIIDNVNDHYSIFVDGEYKGYYNFGSAYKEFCTSADSQTHLRLALSNVIIDDVVVKDAPLLTQYYYTGYRADGTGEIKDWGAGWTQTGENEYGHFSQHDITAFWFSKYYGTVVKIANPTNLDKTAVVFNALYDTSGKLVSVAMSDQKKLNTVAANGTSITEFSVTHNDMRMPANLTNYTSKTMVFDSVDSLTPLYDAIVLD